MQLNMTALTKFESCFWIFLQFLFSEYNIIKNVIDAQNDSNIEKFIQKLQEKEIKLKTSKIAI